MYLGANGRRFKQMNYFLLMHSKMCYQNIGMALPCFASSHAPDFVQEDDKVNLN